MIRLQNSMTGFDIMRQLESISRRRWNYWVGISIEASLAVAVTVFVWQNMFSEQRYLILVPLLFVLGFVIQSFVEYGIHRWIYHGMLALRQGGHAEHHKHPRSLLALPWYLTIALFVAGTSVYCLAFGDAVLGAAAAAGGIIQYFVFGLLHHSYHHQDFNNRHWRKLRTRHGIHHGFVDCNFGGSTQIWDLLLRTDWRTVHPAAPNNREKSLG
jgi:4-hydroxysphinganine ceramide fatty acyl 2-hydroxylase